MKKVILMTLFFPLSVMAADNSADICKAPGRSIESNLLSAMYGSMRIDINQIDRNKTKSRILYENKVSDIFVDQIARESFKANPDHWMDMKDYNRIYSADNPRNLIIEYTYFNKTGRENIFLASAIINDDECSVRFNGYITVKRDF